MSSASCMKCLFVVAYVLYYSAAAIHRVAPRPAAVAVCSTRARCETDLRPPILFFIKPAADARTEFGGHAVRRADSLPLHKYSLLPVSSAGPSLLSTVYCTVLYYTVLYRTAPHRTVSSWEAARKGVVANDEGPRHAADAAEEAFGRRGQVPCPLLGMDYPTGTSSNTTHGGNGAPGYDDD
ncbi:hypothetical protein CERZMDRAFT_83250 [Cercospora zeae-maydis SCOH1-5]|uniref:Uncharacterized protein n=1 Tax=Cercospora zeae-maydis SCOH1-5 TaxID=717836 RepID=A0A6A6FK29_9PEZI|nr:hypothetical protein CERZMDRAFT_83250 [Cercospora zeae-maydis SCOH1-5]